MEMIKKLIVVAMMSIVVAPSLVWTMEVDESAEKEKDEIGKREVGIAMNGVLQAQTSAEQKARLDFFIQKYGVEAKEEGSGGTLLMRATEQGAVELVAMLLDNNACVKKENHLYGSPLIGAVSSGNTEIIEMLLDHGADVNYELSQHYVDIGDTALIQAIIAGNSAMIDYLISKGADVNRPNKDGSIPLVSAIYCENWDMLTVLIGKGADINKVGKCGYTLLEEAIGCYRSDWVDNLIHHGADVNRKCIINGITSLQGAVGNKYCGECGYEATKIIIKLIFAGAKYDAEEFNGYSEEAKLFIAAIVNINKQLGEQNWLMDDLLSLPDYMVSLAGLGVDVRQIIDAYANPLRTKYADYYKDELGALMGNSRTIHDRIKNEKLCTELAINESIRKEIQRRKAGKERVC